MGDNHSSQPIYNRKTLGMAYFSLKKDLPTWIFLPLHPVISQQRGKASAKLRWRAHVVHRRRQSIGSVPQWHFPEVRNYILESFTPALEALRKHTVADSQFEYVSTG